MAALLFSSNILLPLAGGAILLAFAHGEDRHLQRIVSAIILALSLFFTLSAFLSTVPPPRFCFTWLTPAGEMCLSFERSALILTALPCLFLLLLHVILFIKIAPPAPGLALIAYAAMQGALLSEHFLLRYAALEIAGLMVVVATLTLTKPAEKRWDRTARVFLSLRIGDITLLAAIFLMYARSGSFIIAHNFEAALSLPFNLQCIVVVALLVTIWVKMAVWPLDRWAVANASLPPGMREWFLAICLPILGTYLLYRSAALMQATYSHMFTWVFALSLIMYLMVMMQSTGSENRQMIRRAQRQIIAIVLILATYFIDQKGVGAALFLWLVVSMICAFPPKDVTKKIEQGHDKRIYEDVRVTVFTTGFIFLIIWSVSSSVRAAPLVLITLWGMFWLQLIIRVKDLLKLYHPLRKETTIDGQASALRIKLPLLSIYYLTLFAVSAILVQTVSTAVRGAEYSLFKGASALQSLPFINAYFWAGLILALPGLLLQKFSSRFRHIDAQRWIRELLEKAGIRPRESISKPISDPLDISLSVSKLFGAVAAFLYKHLEQESAERISNGLNKIFSFLFDKVERFTSRDLWTRALSSLLQLSRKVQSMHLGLLRFNLLWLFLFMIILVLLFWVSYTGGLV